VKKNLIACFYCPAIFAYVYKGVTYCHECKFFEGKRKLFSFPLKPVSVEAPFQQWDLDFIGEVNLTSTCQHKWIFTAIDYFTKGIEVVPTIQATYVVIIQFLENNIFFQIWLSWEDHD